MEGITLGFITILIGIAMFVYLDRVVRLNQQQNNFLLAVTHELKTPIAAAKLALQTATKRPDSDIVPKMVVMAQSNISRLSVLVEQILMATRFENKFTEPQKVWIELSDFFNGVLENMELKSEDFQRIDIQIPSNLQFYADEQMLSTVIRNLVTNSIKYSEGQGKINIESQINDNNFTLVFTDEGIGISEDEKKNIFKKFYRVGEEKTRTTPGSGLGLFLVKKITEIHGGKVTVENNIPKGSKFILAFSAKDSLLE
jgi:signal transduction histidine kinase